VRPDLARNGCSGRLLSHYLAIVGGAQLGRWSVFDWGLAIGAIVAGALCLPFRIAALLVERRDSLRPLDQIGMMFGILSAGWIILALLV